MKVQTIIFIGIMVVVIAGVTFVKQFFGTSSSNDATGPVDEAKITFPMRVVSFGPDCDIGTKGFQDFWFENTTKKPIELGLDANSCKCSKVEVIRLEPEEEKTVRQEMPAAAATEAGLGALGFAHWLAPAAVTQVNTSAFLSRSERWLPLFRQDETQLVPIAAAGNGFVRLTWDARQIGDHRISAKLWVQEQGNPKTRGGDISLEIPIQVTLPLQVRPDTVPVGDLGPNQFTYREFHCWSSTRADFTLNAYEDHHNPCVTCICKKLEGEEFKKTCESLMIHPLALYLVSVTVQERKLHGPEMELGPYSKMVVLKTDQPDMDQRGVSVNGKIKGDIRVGSEDDRDVILLKTFPINKGTSIRMPIATKQPGMKLVYKSVTPSFIKIDFKEQAELDTGILYDLRLTVPPNRATGKFPPDSAVVLEMQSQPRREVRIPIYGKGTISLDNTR